jgi:peptide chain release factor 1
VASGKGVERAFHNEAGGHRYQRVPPTEKRGRVHTSTVTVAVLAVPEQRELRIDQKDLEWKTCRGSGAGGQHRNTTDSAVQLTHLPTGVSVRCESERSQHQNKALALDVLRARIGQAQAAEVRTGRNAARRQQVGSGMRADKVRTIAIQRDQVHDHRTGRRMSAKAYLRGSVDGLWA